MKILAGGPTADFGTPYFEAHLKTLRAQRENFDESYRIDIVHLDGVNPEGKYRVEGGRHVWYDEDFEWMARLRQSFLNKGDGEGYDAVFMCDTDLLLGPGVLASLMQHGPIAYGVFWTQWPGMDAAMPQVWDMHPCDYHEDSQLIPKLRRDEVAECYGGGACSLIWTEAVRRGARYWPRLQSMPMQSMWRGEDRTFNLTAEVLDLRQMAVPGLPIIHLYDELKRGQRNIDRQMKRLYT
jgi:hypothetical protein